MRTNWRTGLRVVAALSMMLMLTACAGSQGSPTRATVQIPQDCELLAQTVPYPAVSTGQNAKVSVARHRAALGQANGNLVATRTCQEQQRERFANGN
jgi:hypothetical protein